MAKVTVAILFGGISNEHEISCLSANSILHEIDRDKYRVIPIGITKAGRWVVFNEEFIFEDSQSLPKIDNSVIAKNSTALATVNPPLELLTAEVVFPVLHGAWGEDGTVQGLLEMHQVPYVGSGVLASAIGMHKPLMKLLFRQAGLKVSDWKSFSEEEFTRDSERILTEINQLHYPLFAKPARGGSSVGISKVNDANELEQAILTALKHDSIFLVEEAVSEAREIECGVLAASQRLVSVPAEIKVKQSHEFYDYEAKYLDDGAELVVPAELSEEQVREIKALAIRAFDSISCEGLARVDFFLKNNGEIYLNEINTMPGFTPISMYPRTFAESGIGFSELIDLLLKEALERKRGLR